MEYKIRPLYLGYCMVDKSMVLYRNEVGEEYKLPYGAFVLEGAGEYILVDSGTPTMKEIVEKEYTFRQAEDDRSYMEELKKIGVEPEKVKTIILTHLHWDHAWNLEKFPNATIYVQKKEMQHAVTPFPYAMVSYAIESPGGPSWFQAIQRMVPLDGDTEIMPGLRVIMTPGHTCGSQAVLVDTKEGLCAISGDFIMTLSNYTDKIPVGLLASAEDWYDSHSKLKAYAPAVVLPTHDMTIYEREIYG